jgi:hypothetical protein
MRGIREVGSGGQEIRNLEGRNLGRVDRMKKKKGKEEEEACG